MKYSKANIENVSPVIRETLKKNFIESTGRLKKGLLIYGKTGCGKTYTLYATKNSSGDVENWVEVLADMRNNLPQSLNIAIELAKKDTVFLDDIGAEKSTEWSEEMFYLIINRMYIDEKTPIFATNLTLKEFQEKYGDRIFSRLAEMCEFVELTGVDKRLSK